MLSPLQFSPCWRHGLGYRYPTHVPPCPPPTSSSARCEGDKFSLHIHFTTVPSWSPVFLHLYTIHSTSSKKHSCRLQSALQPRLLVNFSAHWRRAARHNTALNPWTATLRAAASRGPALWMSWISFPTIFVPAVHRVSYIPNPGSSQLLRNPPLWPPYLHNLRSIYLHLQ